MRHPLWIVNSSLLVLLIFAGLFIYFTQQPLPKQKKLLKTTTTTHTPKKVESIALSKIHENDLFDTIKQPLPALHEAERIQEAPTPPGQSAANIPHEPASTPLPPITATLKGIILVSDASNNVALISDNATSKEKMYRVGDIVQDGQIIKIAHNQIVLIRSNGQQETLFINERDLLNDPYIRQNAKDWSAVVTLLKDREFEIYPTTFVAVIPSLATLLDMFELTTVYKDGQRIGCRIGDLGTSSFGVALGLQSNDIITKINDKPVATFEERLAIYQAIKDVKIGDICTVEILRNKSPLTFRYIIADQEKSVAKYKTLNAKDTTAQDDKKGILAHQSLEELEQERIAMLKEKYQFAPTIQDMLLEQKNMMLREGTEGRLRDYSFVSEA